MRSLRGLILALLLVVPVGCDRDEPPEPEPTPQTVVADLFKLAREDDPDAARVERVFGAIEEGQRHAALLDAIHALVADAAPLIVETYTMDDGTRTGFDLEASLAGDGVARFSVLLDTTEPPGVIVWFSGPGVEWPERKRRDSGVSTSAPPRKAEGG